MQNTFNNKTDRKRWFVSALLCVALSLPAFFVGEHLHDSLSEEINCDLCLHGVQAAPAEEVEPNIPPATARTETQAWDLIPLEATRLFKYQRGPPLLC